MSTEEDIRELRQNTREDLQKMNTEIRENSFITTRVAESFIRLDVRVGILETLVSPDEFPKQMTNLARDIQTNSGLISDLDSEGGDKVKGLEKDLNKRIEFLEDDLRRAKKIRTWIIGICTVLLTQAIPEIVKNVSLFAKYLGGG